MVYVLGRMGSAEKALRLIIEGLRDVVQASPGPALLWLWLLARRAAVRGGVRVVCGRRCGRRGEGWGGARPPGGRPGRPGWSPLPPASLPGPAIPLHPAFRPSPARSPQAVEFVQLQRDDDLWEQLIALTLGDAQLTGELTGGRRAGAGPPPRRHLRCRYARLLPPCRCCCCMQLCR